jgi:hypothetical protein
MVCRKPRGKYTWNMNENFFKEKPITSCFVEIETMRFMFLTSDLPETKEDFYNTLCIAYPNL